MGGLWAAVFLEKVGIGLSREHLQEGKYSPCDRIFLMLDEEDNDMIAYGLANDLQKFITEISIPVRMQ